MKLILKIYVFCVSVQCAESAWAGMQAHTLAHTQTHTFMLIHTPSPLL